jgi:hypothetical protein
MSKKKTAEQFELEAMESFIEEHGREPDEQELHDWMNRNRRPRLKGSRQRLQATLATPRPPETYHGTDPIEMAMQNHPGLTREKALEDAKRLGF